ncbi:hypothetical protein ACFSTC_02325 [Nonomuraea ferruginea]
MGSRALYATRAAPAATPFDRLVEDTFYLTVGIEVEQRLMPVEKGARIRPGPRLAPGIGVDATGRVYGRPERVGTYAAQVQICRDQACDEERVTFVVLRNVPWAPGALTFPGRAGQRLDGNIQIRGGPTGVPPTFTVTRQAALPPGRHHRPGRARRRRARGVRGVQGAGAHLPGGQLRGRGGDVDRHLTP